MKFKKIKKSVNTHTIEAAIADFEHKLNFEFVPVIANRSCYTDHISWIISLYILIILIALPNTWMPTFSLALLFLLISYFLVHFFDKSDTINRLFISKKEQTKQVQEQAELYFFRNRLHEIPSHNVLLLYISVMERQIVLYHDAKVTFPEMKSLNDELLRTLQNSFKQNNFEDGLLSSIKILSTRLEASFSRPDNASAVNHVPNKLIWIN